MRPSGGSNDKSSTGNVTGPSSNTNLQKKLSNEKLNSSSKGDDAQSSSHRLAKLSQQNVTQPRRREPTSRVAPKNQVSSQSNNNTDQKSNNGHIDMSVLSAGTTQGNTNTSFGVNQSMAQQNMNNSSHMIQGKKVNESTQHQGKNTGSTRLGSGRSTYQNNYAAIGPVPFGASSGGHHPVHPSKKQQLRYQ